MTHRFAAAVLTGGESRRMGRDKALIEVGGRALVLRVIDAARAAGAVEVVTIGGADRGVGVRHAADRYPGAGPLGGIASALVEFPDLPVVVLACDLPAIDATTIGQLASALGDHDVAVARTSRVEPMCAVWNPATSTGVVRDALDTGERAVHSVLTRLRVVEHPVDPAVLVNLNTPTEMTHHLHGGPSTGNRVTN